ncbi:hypothetical protein [Pseudomonas sp. NPDC008258]|uniref:hypothetical protein n=1 Tax=Pseudomonas sp. NPDC008258 TaxID=3364418 RepID=UPI0036EE117D
MQRRTEECLIGQVDLKLAEQSYNVPGFSEAYVHHLEGRAGDQVFYGRLLIFIGSVVAALGMGIALFGPEVIYYDRFSGLTLIQHIQLNPGLVSITGGLMIAWGGKQRNEGIVHREDFLLSHYRFVTDDGRDVSNQVNVRHLGGDDFSVSVGL